MLGEDIGLVEVPEVPVHNKLLSVDIVAKRLVPSSNFYLGDKMLVDNCYAGSQILSCVGGRTGKSRQRIAGPRSDTQCRFGTRDICDHTSLALHKYVLECVGRLSCALNLISLPMHSLEMFVDSFSGQTSRAITCRSCMHTARSLTP